MYFQITKQVHFRTFFSHLEGHTKQFALHENIPKELKHRSYFQPPQPLPRVYCFSCKVYMYFINMQMKIFIGQLDGQTCQILPLLM